MAVTFFTGYLGIGSALSAQNVLTELSGSGYARVPVTLQYDPGSNSVSMPAGVTFPTATGTWTAGTYLAVFDALTAGNNLLVWAQAVPALTSGQSFTYGAQFPLMAVTANLLTLATGASIVLIPAGTTFGTISPVVAGPGGAVAVTAPVALSYSAGVLRASGAVVSLTDATTITVNPALSNYFTVTIGATGRTLVMSPGVNGQVVELEVVQDATGSRTITTTTNVTWASATLPTLTTTANAVDMLRFTYNASAGKWRGETVAKALG
jgi:hypothetical protein